ncbi:hypothetical protein ACFQ6V_09110 [Streptomyces roseifaciens]
MPVPAPCPGSHNDAWRRAEAERAATGIDHDLSAAWGDPLHCSRCTARATSQLLELPELVAAIWLEAAHSSRAPQLGTIGRSTAEPPWPGQPSRLLTDYIVGGLLDLEDDIRHLRRLNPRHPGTREGAAVTGAVRFLATHLDWALTQHPAAAETHSRLSGNPAAQIATWHAAATYFTRRDPGTRKYAAPCPRCDLLSLYRTDGDDYIECRNGVCGLLLTPAEYELSARERAAALTRNAAA